MHEKSKSQVIKSFFSPESCFSTSKKDDFSNISKNFCFSNKPLSLFQNFHDFSSSILTSMHEKSKTITFFEGKK